MIKEKNNVNVDEDENDGNVDDILNYLLNKSKPMHEFRRKPRVMDNFAFGFMTLCTSDYSSDIEDDTLKSAICEKVMCLYGTFKKIFGRKLNKDLASSRHSFGNYYSLRGNRNLIQEIYLNEINGLEIIGENAFINCIELRHVDFGKDIQCIEKGAFKNCFKLHEITLPNTIKILDKECFAGISNLTINYYGTIEQFENVILGERWCGINTTIICFDGIMKKGTYTSNTLVIHPFDESTIPLKYIYEDKGFDVISDPDISSSELKKQIKAHKRIILLGNGTSFGLINPNLAKYQAYIAESDRKYIIDENFVDVLANKDIISLWNDSDEFFAKHNIAGLHSGKIILSIDDIKSLPDSQLLTAEDVLRNVVSLAKIIHDHIDKNPIEIYDNILKNCDSNDEIAVFNNKNWRVL